MEDGNKSNAINGTQEIRFRSRKSGFSQYKVLSDQLPDKKSHPSSRAIYPKSIPFNLVIIVYIFYGGLFALQEYFEKFNYPKVLMLKDAKDHPEAFIAERAMARLIKLTDIGPRVAGSYENEILAADFLKKEILDIMDNINPVHSIKMDVQKYSGSFPLRFLDGLTNVYKNVQDIIVKLSPDKPSPHSLLINCHFDSVTDSPGGSDDGAGCAVMLEILQVLARSDQPLKNNVIFLFNGAEENLMHGSHGFITQHDWSKEVRAFINLEACGAGGREVLFQSGPNSPWIMKFVSFLLFLLKRLDFAWSTNGYVYHTKFDNVDQIPLGSLQRTGENMLELIKGLANAEEMKNIAEHKTGNMIYFDVLGLYLVRWSEEFGAAINVCTVVLSFVLLCVSVIDASKIGIQARTYVLYLIKTLGVVILSSILSLASVLCISGFTSFIGKSMSWYNRPIWLLFLYIIPSMIAQMKVLRYFTDKFLKVLHSQMVLFQMFFDVYQFLWTIILLTSIILRIRSGYVAWMWVFGPCVGLLIHRLIKSPLQRGPDWKWILFLVTSLSLPVIQHINMQAGCLALFIPIMGRSGASLNSEVVIALFVNVTFGMLFAYISPIAVMVENPRNALTCLTSVFVIALGLLLFTPLGFPYSGDIQSPRPQRYMVLQTERMFYDAQGVKSKPEYGYWVVDHDYNSPYTLLPYVPEVAHAIPLDKDCDKYLYCGLPYLMPVLGFIRKTHWIPSKSFKIEKPSNLKVISRDILSENIERVTIEIKGPDHLGLIISPKPNVKFIKWSLNEVGPVKGPTWNGQDTYFVYYACSSDPQPWTVFFDFQVVSHNRTLMDLALTSHILHGPEKTNLQFIKLLAQFPSWTAVTSWTATYKSFVI